MQQFDLVIVGAGAAGLSAAAAAARHGLKVVVVERIGAGGQVMNVDRIENFPGFPQNVSGYELGPLLQEQAEAAGAEFLLDTIERLEVSGQDRLLVGAEGTIHALAVVIAAGSGKRQLGVPGEERLQGRGVSHCASCDGPLFKKLEVCVVGGGDSALDEALALARHASRVTLIHRGPAFSAQQCLVDRVAAAANVDVVFETEVQEILGEANVSGISLRNVRSGEVRLQKTDGVFIYIGLAPDTGFLNGLLRLDASGHVETDLMMQTSLEGVFAAGDIRTGSVAQLAAAAGDGVTAAISAYRYLKRLH
ncbi:MAG: FAD-dependent oxidoreductase [Rhodoferax sp.]|nr:FAD-dependent oxidoreductase [Rhodoferax sp.]